MNNGNRHPDESLREQLSALIDGELPRDQTLFLLKRLEREPALRDEWENLHRIRDGLNAVSSSASGGFAARVMDAIAQESVATGQPALRKPGAAVPRWLQTVAGGAVAAGVAWVALLSTAPQVLQSDTADAVLAVATPASGGAQNSPGSAATGAMLLPQQVFSQASQTSGGSPTTVAPANLRLDRYLLRHSEGLQYAGPAQVVAPYVYSVSFSDRVPVSQAQ